MKPIFKGITKHPKLLLTVYLCIFAVCLVLSRLVSVNYEMNDYLPQDTPSTQAIAVLEREFPGGIPNARVMISDVTVPQALDYKEKLAAIPGVTAVSWLDDAADVTVPFSMLDADTVETYYRDGAALYSVTIEDDALIDAVAAIRALIGQDNAVTGNAVSTADAMTNTVSEIRIIAVLSVLFVLVVLLLTTHSWLEPLLVLGSLGVAIGINSGTNLLFGEISFVTNAAGSILQLAVSLDYSVFLIHRFEECRARESDPAAAMVDALTKSASSIFSSGLTTVIGFLALVLMRFRIGPDLGLALAKGVAISLLTVFVFTPALVLCCCGLLEKTRHRSLLPDLHGFGRFTRRVSRPLAVLFALAIVPAFLASNANDYYFGSSHIFREDSTLGADTAQIEAVFGKSDTYVLLLPGADTAREAALSADLRALPNVTDVLSYVDLAGPEIPPSYLEESQYSQLFSGNYSRMVLSVAVPYEGDETFALVESVRAVAQHYYPDAYYLAGAGVSTYDLMTTVTGDMFKVNLVAIGAVFLILLCTLRSLLLPALLVLSIETAIWINLAVPYFSDSPLFYIAYLIISSVQLGATVDYAILLTDRYRENRRTLEKHAAAVQTVADVTVSVLTSGSALTVVGLLLGFLSSNQLLAQLGTLIGRGALFSLAIVLFVLPGLLLVFDRLIIGRKHRPPGAQNLPESPDSEKEVAS